MINRIDAPPAWPDQDAYRDSLILAIQKKEPGLDLTSKSTAYLEAMIEVLADLAAAKGEPCA